MLVAGGLEIGYELDCTHVHLAALAMRTVHRFVKRSMRARHITHGQQAAARRLMPSVGK